MAQYHVGGMLIECVHYLDRKGGNPRNLTLHGQEKNFGTWAICKTNMLLHVLADARIEKGDTIRDPKLVDEGEFLLYDRVIANPPFSLDEWGRDVAENDGYGRFRFGVPPKTKGDLTFVQHMVAVLNGTGRLGVVIPHRVLFRGSTEGKIRQGLPAEDLVEGVIGLALPVPHISSLDFMKPLRYRARHGGAESSRAPLADRSCPSSRCARQRGSSRHHQPRTTRRPRL